MKDKTIAAIKLVEGKIYRNKKLIEQIQKLYQSYILIPDKFEQGRLMKSKTQLMIWKIF
jgi:hypothetical protein